MTEELVERVATDIRVTIRNGIRVEGTVTTMQEAEELCEIIRHLGQNLPSHRMMIAADIGIEPPKPKWRDELYRLFGDPTQPIRSLSSPILTEEG